MARVKPMGTGALVIVFLAVIVAVPIVLHFLRRTSIAGFEDVTPPAGPARSSNGRLGTNVPDPNTNYLCDSPGNSGIPCPEGQFCDGTTQSCQPKYVGGAVPSTGYYA